MVILIRLVLCAVLMVCGTAWINKDEYGKDYAMSQIDSDSEKIKELMTGCAVAIGATSYEHNLIYSRAAVETGCSFIDLGGNHDVVDEEFSMNDEAKEAGITMIPDCGLAPGLVSILSARALDS